MTIRLSAFAALCLAWPLASFGLSLATAGPPQSPLLRLETGAHTARISSIATDRAGRWIASASHDKTLRLWDATDGRLLRTYRLPIGAGLEGKLYAVAMDPDGAWIATGGWNKLGSAGSDAHSIFILERAGGQLLRRIDGLERGILRLSVSADGRRLAATLGGDQGLRVYAPRAGFREVFADREYGDHSFDCAFAADGRLVTSSLDGKLRLYVPDGDGLRRAADRSYPNGKRPVGVAFHPDGQRIAVGFYDSPRVDIVDGENLSLRYSADTADIERGSFSHVTWSRDGRRLLAGGACLDGSGINTLLSWNRAGRGVRRPWPAADNTVMDLVPLPDGGVAVGTADADLLVFDRAGRTRLRVDSAIANLSGSLGDGFLLAADARRIAFYFVYLARRHKDRVWFDLDERRLQRGIPDGADADPVRTLQQALATRGYDPGPIDGVLGPVTRAAVERFRRDRGIGGSGIDAALHQALGISTLAPPRTAAPGLDIRGWEHTAEPTLNGTPLALQKSQSLEKYEEARSLAIAPDGERFLLGADLSLRLFDRKGRKLWENPATGVVGVNVSGDGRLGVAAFSDGIIRWYRLSDGAELLTLFPHRNGTDWVLWTPSGYYDASPGGDRLIGWHLNNGRDAAADFMPAGQLRARFYRPAVVAAILDTLDESAALSRAGIRQATEVAAAMPPVLELLEPADGASFGDPRVRVRYHAKSRHGEPIVAVRALVDGRPLPEAHGLGRIDASGIATLTLTLPERDLELALIAENRHGASVPATARLTWAGRAPAPFLLKPKLYALAIGVGDYRDDDLDLLYPAKDAHDFAAAVEAQAGGLYREVEIEVLTDPDAERILDGLDWLRAQVTGKDLGLLFLAGHGVNDSDGDYYFLPADVDTERLRRSAVPYYEIKKTLSALAGKTLAFIDTCHSGNVMGARRGVADINAIVHDLAAAENGVVVFASSTGRQYSEENSLWGNGAFTKALVEGLRGKADHGRRLPDRGGALSDPTGSPAAGRQALNGQDRQDTVSNFNELRKGKFNMTFVEDNRNIMFLL